MRGWVRTKIHPWLWKAYRWYSRKKRWYRFDGLEICIYPSVFHPALFGTTKYLLDFARRQQLQQKRVLELGAGSGLISLWLSRAGATVSASDINSAALRSIQESADANQLSVQTYHSDLFKEIPVQEFDCILVNPPFYPESPQNDRDHAFFCGPNFEYFQQFFTQIPSYIHPQTQIYFILTDDCDLPTISDLAKAAGRSMVLEEERKYWGERQLIYRVDNC